MHKIGIERCIEIARERGGQCLSTEYINNETKMHWRCAEGHEWWACWGGGIQQGQWCPKCGRIKVNISNISRRIGIERCKEIANERRGKCLSTEYINAMTKMHWQCSKGHEWTANLNQIQQKNWCPICAGHQPIGIDRCKQWALAQGGECLSTKYINRNTKLRWRCAKRHEWNAAWGSTGQGHWCPICTAEKQGKTYKIDIDDCKRIATERRYRCLSEKYLNTRTPLRWQCDSCGREWKACLNSIKRGSGCPHCHTHDMENRCRVIFETIFEKLFPRCKPFKHLGSLLELDGYNSELSIAFEYDGEQHRTGKRFGQHETNPLIFERDHKKDTLCKQNSISLIRINDLEATQENLVNVIINKLNNNNIAFSTPSNEVIFNLKNPLDPIYKRIWGTKYLQKLREVCNSHIDPATGQRGILLSADVWIRSQYKYNIQCEYNHLFKGTYECIVHRNYWCPKCGRKQINKALSLRKIGIEQCKQAARKYSGECISREYINSQTKLRWRCTKGHEWDAAYNTIQQGHWCFKCAHEKPWNKDRARRKAPC